jgi:ribosomal protein S18 acetylase RimI-like enzyme
VSGVRSQPNLDRAGVLAWAHGHPYARFALARATRVDGLRGDRALLVLTGTGNGWMGHGLGDPDEVDVLFRRALAAGRLDDVRWLNLPRRTADSIPAGFEVNDHWDVRWSLGPLPDPPGRDRAVALGDDDAPAVNALLDLAFPSTMVRPGHPMALGWFGIRAGPALVACAADRSTRSSDPTAMPVGVIGGVAVHPEHRGRGLGAAVTAAVARPLLDRYGLVTLGVIAGNDVATRMYGRLGFTGVTELTSIRPQDRGNLSQVAP